MARDRRRRGGSCSRFEQHRREVDAGRCRDQAVVWGLRDQYEPVPLENLDHPHIPQRTSQRSSAARRSVRQERAAAPYDPGGGQRRVRSGYQVNDVVGP